MKQMLSLLVAILLQQLAACNETSKKTIAVIVERSHPNAPSGLQIVYRFKHAGREYIDTALYKNHQQVVADSIMIEFEPQNPQNTRVVATELK
jgi:hypothetical protein